MKNLKLKGVFVYIVIGLFLLFGCSNSPTVSPINEPPEDEARSYVCDVNILFGEVYANNVPQGITTIACKWLSDSMVVIVQVRSIDKWEEPFDYWIGSNSIIIQYEPNTNWEYRIAGIRG